jgi:hypothetical protein
MDSMGPESSLGEQDPTAKLAMNNTRRRTAIFVELLVDGEYCFSIISSFSV